MAVAHSASFSGSGNIADPVVVSVVAVSSDFVIACCALGDGVAVNTIDFGASTDVFTLVPSSIADNAGAGHTEIWYATGLSGTETVTVHCDAKGQNIIGVGVFTGADTPDNALTEVADAQASPQIIGPPTGMDSDNMAVDCFRSPGNSPNVGGNQTEIMNLTAGGEQGAASWEDGADGGTMGWSFTGTPDIAHSACRIPEGVAGGPAVAVFGHNQIHNTLN